MQFLRKLCGPFGIPVALALGGCAVLSLIGLHSEPVRFSHSLHVKDQGLDCLSCHANAEEGDKAGMPEIAQCQLCHEGIDENRPPEKKLGALLGENPQWSRVTTIPEDVRFSHRVHKVAAVACAQCHTGIEDSKSISKEVQVSMEICVRCHAEKGVGTNKELADVDAEDCSLCHEAIRKDSKPGSHFHNWKKFHGQTVRAGSEKTQDRCSICHTESSCTVCHQSESPQNHNNHWRQRGHGIAASIDRGSCAVCHKSDSCDQCHSESAPRNHMGSWGGSTSRHCLTCHLPVQGEQCFVCHKSTVSHNQAAAKPAGHNSAMNCRQCHGLSQPLPHVDKGDDCNVCHH